MLFADVPPETLFQASAIIVTTIVGAWVTVKLARIDKEARRQRRLSRAERQRCNALEVRVEELEKALHACLSNRKPRRRNTRPAE